MPYLLRLPWFAAIFLAVCACASLVGYAVARANPLLGVITDRVMAEVDLNEDRKVARGEFAEVRSARFTSADQDKDDRITQDEFTAELTSVAGELGLVWGSQFFGVMDRDGDGYLAREEMNMLAETAFGELDRNGDGFVTPSEVHPSLAMAQ